MLHVAPCTQLSCSVAGLSRPFHSRHFLQRRGPTTPVRPEPHWFGLLPVRSPLLGESRLFSFPPGTKMFQFPGLAPLMRCQAFSLAGCPIRRSADQRPFAPARGLSQLITSFFACKSQGIRHTPFPTFFRSLRPSTAGGRIPSRENRDAPAPGGRPPFRILSAVLVKSSK